MNLEIPSDLQPTLAAIKKHYQEVIDYAQAQITHAEALLGKPVFSLTPLLPLEKSQPVSAPAPAIANKAPIAVTNVAKTAKTQGSSTKSSSLKGKSSPKSKSVNLKPKDLFELKPQYQGKAILVAIGEALKSREGEALLTSEITRELHGDKLSPDLFKLAKGRLLKSLSKGKIDGLWDGVPGKTGYYTFSLKTLKS
jgi:hypothetical protein